MKKKPNKVRRFLRTDFFHSLLSLGIASCYIPIVCSNDIQIVKGLYIIILSLFSLYICIPISRYQIMWEELKDFAFEMKKDDKAAGNETSEDLQYIIKAINILEESTK